TLPPRTDFGPVVQRVAIRELPRARTVPDHQTRRQESLPGCADALRRGRNGARRDAVTLSISRTLRSISRFPGGPRPPGLRHEVSARLVKIPPQTVPHDPQVQDRVDVEKHLDEKKEPGNPRPALPEHIDDVGRKEHRGPKVSRLRRFDVPGDRSKVRSAAFLHVDGQIEIAEGSVP